MALADKWGILEEDHNRFFQDIQAYSWGFVQDVFTFLKMINEKGYSLDFAMKCILIRKENYMERVKAIRRIEELWRDRGLKCPECGKQMFLEPVNSGPADQVPGGWRSIWRCVDIVDCGHEELSKKSVGEWLRRLHLDFSKLRMVFPKESLPEEIMTINGPDFPAPDQGGIEND